MSCKCCCENTLNLCDQDVCIGINMGIAVQSPGAHKLKLFFLGTLITLETEFGVGQQMIFPADNLNESYEYTAELYDPNGNRINIKKSDVDYDCFKFRTYIGIVFSNAEISS